MSDNPILALIIEAKAIALSFVIAAFFGLIRYLQDFLVADPPAFKWFVFSAKILTAGSVGLVVYWLLLEWKITGGYNAFLIAVAGYGGAESLNAFKEAGLDFLRRKAAAGPKD